MNHINVNFVDERKKYVEEVLAHQFDQLPSLPVQATHLVFVYEGSNNRKDQHNEQSAFQEELAKQLGLDEISLQSQKLGEARYEGIVNSMQYRLRWEEHSAFFCLYVLTFWR
ncbi:MAG: hypothetical protein WC856_26340 [Methylococcaceae bacterium]|jgi:hypothetical protein